MALTPVQGWTVPGGGDAPANASAFASLAAQIEQTVVMVFATTTERDSKVATRRKGMICFVAALGYHQRVVTDGGAWGPLASIDAFRGNEGPYVGAAPPAGTLKIYEQDTAVTTVANGAGRFDIPLHTPFQNGLVAVQMTAASSGGPMGWVRTDIVYTTLATISGVAFQPGGAYVASGAGIRLNYAAVGW